MSIEVLWATRSPRWEAVATWAGTPRRPIPRPGQLGGLDDRPGWVSAVRVDGAIFYGHDHYRINPSQVVVWSDDPEDEPYEPGMCRVYGRRTGLASLRPLGRYRGAVRHGIWLVAKDWQDLGIVGPCACRASAPLRGG